MFKSETGRQALLKLYGLSSLYIPCAVFHALKKEVVDDLPAAAQVMLDKDNKTVMQFNEETMLELSNNNPEKFLSIILHEILHVMYLHLYRLTKYMSNPVDRFICQIAADHIVNLHLINGFYGKREMAEGAIIINELRDSNLSFEEVFEYLKQRTTISAVMMKKSLSMPSPGIDSDISESSGSQGNSGSEHEEHPDSQGIPNQDTNVEIVPIESSSDISKIKSDPSSTIVAVIATVKLDDGTERSIVVPVDLKISLSAKDDSAITNSEMLKIQSIVSSLLNDDFIRSRGLVPAGLREFLEKLINPPVPYEKILEKTLKSLIVEKSNRSWRNYNKIFRTATNLILPDVENEYRPSNIVISIDTSGSMTLTDIAKGLGIVVGLIEHDTRVIIIQHDSDIQSRKEFTPATLDINELRQIKGRGGTSHKPVFDIVQEMVDSNKEIGVYIIYSDLYSDIGEIYSNYTFYRDVPIIVITPQKTNYESVTASMSGFEKFSDLILSVDGRILKE